MERTVVRRTGRLAVACGAVTASVGALVLAGWALQVTALERLSPGLATMKANTAAALAGCGLGVVARAVGRGPTARIVAAIMAAIVVAIAATSLVESASGIDLGVDQLVFADPATAAADHPGRPSAATALALLCVGVSLAVLDRAPALAQALAAAAVAVLALLGYAYGVAALYGVRMFSTVALHTAALLAVVSVGTLMARPLRCVPWLLVSRSRGGTLARRLLPATVIVPLVVGWACLGGLRAGLYAVGFGFALFALASIGVFFGLVWLNASALGASDARRRRLEADRDALLVAERAARAAAERAVAARDQLLSVVSHELRTPLTPVLLIASQLRRRAELPADVTADLQLICEQVQIESRLIEDLLDVVSLRQDKLKPQRAGLDAQPLVRAVAATFAGPFAAVGIALRVAAANGPVPVVGDAGRLQQVVRNLLANALKFTPAGGSVDVRCSAVDGQACLDVTDTGVGIPAEAMGRIFDPFEQADASITRRFGGLGLGLSIGRRLAELHGGTLTAASGGPGLGSQFRLRLPLAGPDAIADPVVTDPVVTEPATPRPAAPQRILLVEDDPVALRTLARLLTAGGHAVTPAASAGAALDAARRAEPPFDLLISDIGLPDVSGWDLIARLGDRRPARGIALSGFATDADRRRSLDSGFAHHLTKPIDVAVLTDLIRSLSPLTAAIGRPATAPPFA